MRFAVLDIETRIDKRLLRDSLYADQQIDEEQAYLRMSGELGGGFFPTSLHVPISIAIGNVDENHVLEAVETLAPTPYSEAALVREFWRRAESFTGGLVTFNGRGFDLHRCTGGASHAALRHGISGAVTPSPSPLRRASSFRPPGLSHQPR